MANPAEKDTLGKVAARMRPAHVASLLHRGAVCVKERGWQALGREISFRWSLATHGEVWQHRADIPLRRELKEQRAATFAKMPCISIVVPLYNTPPLYLKEMIDSVRGQSYANWQLVLADASADESLAPLVHKYNDARILYKKLQKNEGIAGNTNAGFAMATGDYIALLDHDDTLSLNALYEAVKAINEQQADFIYSDEIVLSADMKKLVQYHFKPDFSPDMLRGCNYITHFSVFSRALLEAAGGREDPACDGAQDFDIILRLTEKAQHVYHIPLVLYHWRAAATSTAGGMSEAKPYAIAAGVRAIEGQLQRLAMPGKTQPLDGCPGAYRTEYEVKNNPSVCVIIPNKDHTDDLARCLDSFYQNSGWENISVLVVENNSTDEATFAFYEKAKQQYKNLSVVTYQGGFNFSAVCNFGVQHTTAEHILLLNNDIEITSPNFVREMLSYSQRADVGAVGAKLLYPDGTIQHAGVIVGIGGSAGHSHKGLPAENTGDMYRLVTTQNFSAVTGAALMTKRSLFEQLGGLDEENFAVAYNDVDYCLRLREMGKWNVMTPFATALHYESKSRGADTAGGAAQERYEGEKARFCAKWQQYFAAVDPFYNPHFTLLYENYGYK